MGWSFAAAGALLSALYCTHSHTHAHARTHARTHAHANPQVVAAALVLGLLPDSLAAGATASPALAAAHAGSLPAGASQAAAGWVPGMQDLDPPEDDLDLEPPVEIYQQQRPQQEQQQQQPQQQQQQQQARSQQQSQDAGPPAAPAPLPPHLARVLQAPGPEALEVHRRWLQGMPLAQAGALGGGISLAVRGGVTTLCIR